MIPLSKKQVEERRRKEEAEWNGKIESLRRLHTQLLEKIRLSKLDFPSEREREIAAFVQFQLDMQNKKQGILREHEEWREKIRTMEDIVDAIQLREDAMNEREQLISERRRNLDQRERIILAAERRLNQVELC